jgi:hypothetical protein
VAKKGEGEKFERESVLGKKLSRVKVLLKKGNKHMSATSSAPATSTASSTMSTPGSSQTILGFMKQDNQQQKTEHEKKMEELTQSFFSLSTHTKK